MAAKLDDAGASMIRNLKDRIFSAGKLNLTSFFEEMPSRHDLVLAFIAVLEIVRTESVRLIQEQVFGEIFLKKS